MKASNLTPTTALARAILKFAANAHSTLEQTEEASYKATKITLRVPHGCDGDVTNRFASSFRAASTP